MLSRLSDFRYRTARYLRPKTMSISAMRQLPTHLQRWSSIGYFGRMTVRDGHASEKVPHAEVG